MKFMSLMLFVFILAACSDGMSEPKYNFMPPADGIAAKSGDIKITNEELMEGIESDLYEAEMKVFEIKFNRVKTLVIEKLIEQDPRKKGLTNDEYLEKYIASTIKISDKDINKFIKEKNIPAEHINPQIKERIKSFLVLEKKKEVIDNWLAEKTGKSGITVYLNKPQRPTFNVELGEAPVKGNNDAKVTIVEFSDFQCPFCKKAAQTIDEVKKKYGDKVRIVFKHYPLPFHKFAQKAAEASLCAFEQDKAKFWTMHDEMFNHQDELSLDGLKALAKKISLDTKKFDSCLESNKYEAVVKSNIEQGQELGVKSTPTFFVNGKLVSGAQPIEEFSKIIDEELN